MLVPRKSHSSVLIGCIINYIQDMQTCSVSFVISIWQKTHCSHNTLININFLTEASNHAAECQRYHLKHTDGLTHPHKYWLIWYETVTKQHECCWCWKLQWWA